MGIVMTIFMLLGIVLLAPWPARLRDGLLGRPNLVRVIAVGLTAAGMWNALWYGLRHPTAFWGIAALVSGLLMITVGALALTGRGAADDSAGRRSTGIHGRPMALQALLLVALLACFLLYAWTLVRLNLGYAIIG